MLKLMDTIVLSELVGAVIVGMLLLLVFILTSALRKQGLSLKLSEKEYEKILSEKSYLDGQVGELFLLKNNLFEKEKQITALYAKENELITEVTRLKTQQQHESKTHLEKIELLKDSKQQLAIEFEQLANKLLDAKSAKFKEQQEGFFDQTLRPLKEQLTEFRQRIDKVHESDSKDRVQLHSEILHLKSLNQQMSEDTINLTNALKGNQKFQGNWGEFILERVLEDSGLRKGYEYELQAKRYDETGKLRLPDVIIHLPDNKDLIIDAKVSLIDYQRYCESNDAAAKEQFLKTHLRSLEQHIKGLSIKDYELLEGINTLDFVLLFVPIEAAFLLALESSPSLFQLAYDRHIILVSPTTLLATLRTVENLWRYERQNKNAEEIARQAGGLYDQCVLFVESLDEVGRCLNKSTEAFDKSMQRLSGGRGNMLGRIDRLKQLGAKTKKQLPDHFAVELSSDMPDEND